MKFGYGIIIEVWSQTWLERVTQSQSDSHRVMFSHTAYSKSNGSHGRVKYSQIGMKSYRAKQSQAKSKRVKKAYTELKVLGTFLRGFFISTL